MFVEGSTELVPAERVGEVEVSHFGVTLSELSQARVDRFHVVIQLCRRDRTIDAREARGLERAAAVDAILDRGLADQNDMLSPADQSQYGLREPVDEAFSCRRITRPRRGQHDDRVAIDMCANGLDRGNAVGTVAVEEVGHRITEDRRAGLVFGISETGAGLRRKSAHDADVVGGIRIAPQQNRRLSLSGGPDHALRVPQVGRREPASLTDVAEAVGRALALPGVVQSQSIVGREGVHSVAAGGHDEGREGADQGRRQQVEACQHDAERRIAAPGRLLDEAPAECRERENRRRGPPRGGGVQRPMAVAQVRQDRPVPEVGRV